MTRQPQHADWVVYLVILAVVAGIMLGKYLIAKGDEPIEQVIKEDIEEMEDSLEKLEENIEKN